MNGDRLLTISYAFRGICIAITFAYAIRCLCEWAGILP